MDHHDDAKFFLAGGAKWAAEGGQTLKPYVIFAKAANHQLDESAFAGFEIAEEQKAAFAPYFNYLAGAHIFKRKPGFPEQKAGLIFKGEYTVK